jgi:phage terminase large subunit-like protein
MEWTTALPDWEQRIVAGKSLVPCKPLFKSEAEAALDVFKSLHVVDVGATFADAGSEWIFDLVGAIFGACNPETGKRLIREFFVCVSKKNSKSTLAAGVMLTALIRNWRKSNELLILAPTIEAAQNSFRPAADMVRADPALDAAAGGFLHIQDHIRTITHLKTKAVLKVVAAEGATVVGKKAAFVLIDELWELGLKANADAMLREATGGLIARPEGFVMSITTQSVAPPAGVFKDKLEYARKVRDGVIADKKFLPVIYEFPEKMLKNDEHMKPENWRITNPNMGRSVSREWLEDEMRKELAKDDLSTRNTFFAKHLNVEINQSLRADGWAGAALWPRGAEKGLTLKEVIRRSEVLTIGTDGGGLDDLLGIAVIGRERGTGRWLAWAHAFISPEGWSRRKANQTIYQDFIRDGDLTLVERLPDDLAALVGIVEQCLDSGKLAKVGADPAGIGGIVDALAEIDVTEENGLLGGVRQGVALMGAIKAVERKLVDGSFRHGGRPLMAWCAGNAIVQATATGMRIARDMSGYGKIDPLMALLDAADLMGTNPEPQGSIYDEMDDEPAQSGAVQVDMGGIDMTILADPSHPQWHKMRERFDARLPDDDEMY